MKNNVYLRQLSSEDSLDCYELLHHIGKAENDFTNPVSEMSFDEFKMWLKQQDDWSKGYKLPKGYVPQYCYWLIANGVPVGFGKIRLGLTEQSRIEGGNIGYAIDSRYRGKGYGTKLLSLLLQKSKELGNKEILITVKKYNYSSKGVAEKNGCIVIKETDGWWYLSIKNN